MILDVILASYRLLEGQKVVKLKGKTYDDKRQKAEELHKKGVKQKDIAEQLGVNARTLRNWGVQRKKWKSGK